MPDAVKLSAGGHRDCDPEIGQYISRGPSGYGDGLNVYPYVHNHLGIG